MGGGGIGPDPSGAIGGAIAGGAIGGAMPGSGMGGGAIGAASDGGSNADEGRLAVVDACVTAATGALFAIGASDAGGMICEDAKAGGPIDGGGACREPICD
jgi:hypothetical protein